MPPIPARATTVPTTMRVRLFCRVPGGIEVIRRGRGCAGAIRLSFWGRLPLRQQRTPLPADFIHHNPQQVAIVPLFATEVPFLLGHLGLKIGNGQCRRPPPRFLGQQPAIVIVGLLFPLGGIGAGFLDRAAGVGD